MTLDEFRVFVQKTLKDERGVTDVAFTPFANCDAERVSFWQGSVRAHFAISTLQVMQLATPALLRKLVLDHAENAHKIALEVEAIEAAKRAEELAAQVKVVA